MPDEQREPKPASSDDRREIKPTETKPERRATKRPSYMTEDGENPLICRGID